MKAGDVPWARLLSEASERVQSLVSAISVGGDRARVVGTGASGDKTLLADRLAEEELLRALSAVDGLRVLSEEGGTGGDPRGRTVAVVDPLDGSANFERGIPFYCTSVAVVKGDSLGGVSFGLVRNLVSGDVYWAEKGKGATKNGKRIHTSRAPSLSESVVDIDMSRVEPALVVGLASLVSSVSRQVHYGANALELCFLAEGRFDAFVDLRGRMRITDFAAAYLIAKEAGAAVTDASGSALKPVLDLGRGFSFVASANRRLHDKILELCREAAGRRG